MEQTELTRRDALRAGAAGAAALSVLQVSRSGDGLPPRCSGEGTVVVPWLDQPAPVPAPLPSAA